jgi:hypothetical protein
MTGTDIARGLGVVIIVLNECLNESQANVNPIAIANVAAGRRFN